MKTSNFVWQWVVLESNMLGRNTQSTLLNAAKMFILYHWNGQGNYIVQLFWNGTINKNMPPCLCLDMWRVICVNVNTKIQHAPSMYHKWERLDYGVKKKCASNESNKPILPPKDTKYIQMLVGNFLYYDIAVEPTMLLA